LPANSRCSAWSPLVTGTVVVVAAAELELDEPQAAKAPAAVRPPAVTKPTA